MRRSWAKAKVDQMDRNTTTRQTPQHLYSTSIDQNIRNDENEIKSNFDESALVRAVRKRVTVECVADVSASTAYTLHIMLILLKREIIEIIEYE